MVSFKKKDVHSSNVHFPLLGCDGIYAEHIPIPILSAAVIRRKRHPLVAFFSHPLNVQKEERKKHKKNDIEGHFDRTPFFHGLIPKTTRHHSINRVNSEKLLIDNLAYSSR